MWGKIRKLLGYVGVPTDEEIDAKIKAAAESARRSGLEEGIESGREQARDDYQRKLIDLRQDMIFEKELEKKAQRLDERLAKLDAQEKKVSSLSDMIKIKEFKLVINYAKTLPQEQSLPACDSCEVILEAAQRAESGLSVIARDFFNNFAYLDEKLGESRGYKLLTWITDTFQFLDKSNRAAEKLAEAGTLLRYFRVLIDEKGADDVIGKADKCTGDPNYYNRHLKANAQKKIEGIDLLHKEYAGGLDELSLDLLKERGSRGSFAAMLEESRKEIREGDACVVVGRDSLASRITRLRELSNYEKENNINLYDYINQEAL